MIIVKLQGGLGNQMFQYAFGKALARLHQRAFAIDRSFLDDKTIRKNITPRVYELDKFNLKCQQLKNNDLWRYGFYFNHQTNVLSKILKKGHYQFHKNIMIEQDRYQHHSFLLKKNHHYYFDGYWQSYNYPLSIKKELEQDFTLKLSHKPHVLDLLKKIQSKNSVCIQVRRGDFVGLKEAIGVAYFKKAYEIISSKITNPIFYVFADDQEWARVNLNFNTKINFITPIYNGVQYGSKFFLMKHCKHFIIPNSTFGWWAAWLGKAANKMIITPKNWVKKNPNLDTSGLIFKEWIRI